MNNLIDFPGGNPREFAEFIEVHRSVRLAFQFDVADHQLNRVKKLTWKQLKTEEPPIFTRIEPESKWPVFCVQHPERISNQSLAKQLLTPHLD